MKKKYRITRIAHHEVAILVDASSMAEAIFLSHEIDDHLWWKQAATDFIEKDPCRVELFAQAVEEEEEA